MRSLFFAFLLGMTTMNSSHAHDSIHIPAPGSTERQEVLDAVRGPLQEKLGKPVQFVVQQLRVGDDWAFLSAHMRDADGAALDYTGTSYAEAASQGVMSKTYAALLQRVGGRWQLRAEAIGPTDLAWQAWPQQHGAPVELFQP